MKNKNFTRQISLCGIFAALSVVFLLIGGMTVLDLSVLAVCALMTMLLVVEAGVKMTWIYAAVTGVLALIFLPNKLYAIEYIVFSAVYPLAKLAFERQRQIIAWPLKLSFLDSMLMLVIILGQKVFLLGDEFYSLNMITMILGTLFFIVFDMALTACITVYLVKLRKKLGLK
ncbi:MAG: hypothetical protein IJF78_09715 [Clostridia bacterium]|nr:hypothetical protein [Clostridia bacterium]